MLIEKKMTDFDCSLFCTFTITLALWLYICIHPDGLLLSTILDTAIPIMCCRVANLLLLLFVLELRAWSEATNLDP